MIGSAIQSGLRIMAAALFIVSAGGTALAQAESESEALVTESRLSVDRLMADKDFFQLPNFIKNAKGIYIVPQLVKGGFIIGAEGGSGVFLARGTDGSWSAPAFYTLAAGSIGLQVGGEVKEVVFVLMSDKAVDAMLSSEFKLGADASISVGPIGRGVEASRTTDLTSDIYAFSKSVGLFGGGALEGAKIFERESLNTGYYGSGATARSIVIDRKFSNAQADKLRETLP
ncbi:lipid-binding SYLF domain-containing protein [Pelagibius sp.]|uniref:lipid-binding SYLF domain-containing protein n=1 Tax=Pelagibius sp. TaxID=1931238 RepID=UPI003BB1A42D